MTPDIQYGTILQKGAITVYLMEPTKEFPFKHLIKVITNPRAELNNQILNEAFILKKLEPVIGKRLLKDGFYQNKNALWIKYIEGVNLTNLIEARTRLHLADFYNIAIKICREVQKLHDVQVYHGILCNENIIFEPNGSLQIVNYQLATTEATRFTHLMTPEILSENILTLAPEQTGRVNWSVDNRTDLYSLGMIFYRMLTGKPAFSYEDFNDYIYAHVAETPPLVHQINTGVPKELSTVIAKMVEKSPEKRYQTINGVLEDLEYLQNASPEELLEFEPALNDFSAELQLTEKVIGRDDVLHGIKSFYNKGDQTKIKFALLCGPSGSGKNKIAQEIGGQFTQMNGLQLWAKFNSSGTNRPFSAFVEIIKTYLQVLQTKDASVTEEWKRKVNFLIKNNLETLFPLIPELRNFFELEENINQQKVIDSENQILYLFAKLLNSLSNPSLPVLIVLDDLQWADQNSLKLLRFILNIGEFPFINILGTLRDSNNYPPHVELFLEEQKAAKEGYQLFETRNFDLGSTLEFISTSIHRHKEQVQTLAEIVQEKTGGNPFYIMRFMQTLHEEKELYFHPDFREWMWKEDDIKRRGVTNNVVDFLIQRIDQLPEMAKEVLKIAAIYGTSIPDIVFHWLIETTNPGEIQHTIEQLLGLKIFQTSFGVDEKWQIVESQEKRFYQFNHDRLLEAILRKMKEGEKQDYQRKIGRSILHHLGRDIIEHNEWLFKITDHLNLGEKSVQHPDRSFLFELNFKSGKSAKITASFDQALYYFEEAERNAAFIELEERDRLDLRVHLAEAYQFSGNDQEAERIYFALFNESNDLTNKAQVGEKIIHFYTNNGEHKKSYDFGCKLLQNFGIKLHATPSKPRLILKVVRIRLKLIKYNYERIHNLPESKDIYHIMVVKIIASMLKSAYQIAPELCVEGAAKIVSECLRKGNTSDCPVGYFVFGGIFIGGILGDHQKGFEFGKLALSLVDKYNVTQQRSEIEFINSYFCNTWVKGPEDSKLNFKKAYQSGSMIGDFFHMSCALSASLENDLLFGKPLERIASESGEYLNFVNQTKFVEMKIAIHSVVASVQMLNQVKQVHGLVQVDSFDGNNFEPQSNEFTAKHFIHMHFINQMMVAVFTAEYELGILALQQSKTLLEESAGMQHRLWHHFYACILEIQRKNYAEVNKNLAPLKKAAHFNKSLYLPIYAFAKQLRELAIHNNQKNIDQLINVQKQLQDSPHLHLYALCSEFLAKYSVDITDNELSKNFLEEAIHAYADWGANQCISRLELLYHLPSRFEYLEDESKEVSSVVQYFDTDALMRASRAISEEIQMDLLVKKVMKIIVQHAVATRAFLAIVNDDKAIIYARYTNNQIETQLNINLIDDIQSGEYPASIFHYVWRTKKTLSMDNAQHHELFASDNYIMNNKSLSVYCQPLLLQQKVIGMIFLGNNLSEGQYQADKLQILEMLGTQMAISINNSLQYERLEEIIVDRTAEVTKQKELLEEKNQEIAQSINYARTIQKALSPNVKKLTEYFDSSFLVQKPKDVLNGDFFWSMTLENKLFFAVADCTGHGVPAAMLSLVCYNCISRATASHHNESASKILDVTSELLCETFESSGKRIQDGMDVAFGIFEKSNLTFQFSGANIPLVMQPINQTGEIITIRPTKQPVGPYFSRQPFENHEIQLAKGDILILATDGYADQFGGENSKKLKKQGFIDVLRGIDRNNFALQDQFLHNQFDRWKGDNSQVDDVTVLGILV